MTMGTNNHYLNWSVIGHQWAIRQLDLALRNERNRHAYLLTGPDSIGKTTLARGLAMALNCTHESYRPCGECRSCRLIMHDNHPDVFYVEAERVGGTLKIDQIREVQQQLSLRPYEGRYKVAILLRLHEARGQTQDALLKTLEEPGPQAVFVLTATHTDALLSTITSRCQVLNLRPLSLQETHQALMDHWGLSGDDAAILAHLSGGRLGWAVQAIQDKQALDFRDEMLGQLEQVIHRTRLGRFQIAEQLVKQDKTVLLNMLDIWLTYWRDVLLLAAGSQAPLVNIDHEDTLTTIARAIDKDSAQQAVEATRRSADYLLKNANTRLCIEVLLLDYPRLRT